jgi:hypothetical protein
VLSRVARGWGNLGAGLAYDLVIALVVVSADSNLKVTEAPAERTTDLRKPLWAEHEQGNHEDKDEMRGLKDVANHDTELSR